MGIYGLTFLFLSSLVNPDAILWNRQSYAYKGLQNITHISRQYIWKNQNAVIEWK
jgi:hypothetical protein